MISFEILIIFLILILIIKNRFSSHFIFFSIINYLTIFYLFRFFYTFDLFMPNDVSLAIGHNNYNGSSNKEKFLDFNLSILLPIILSFIIYYLFLKKNHVNK